VNLHHKIVLDFDQSRLGLSAQKKKMLFLRQTGAYRADCGEDVNIMRDAILNFRKRTVAS
jgi:hypothetical protein